MNTSEYILTEVLPLYRPGTAAAAAVAATAEYVRGREQAGPREEHFTFPNKLGCTVRAEIENGEPLITLCPDDNTRAEGVAPGEYVLEPDNA